MSNKNYIAPDSAIHEELNFIYKKFYSIKNFRKKVNKSYSDVLDNNKVLKLILKLLVTCTIGIYVLIAMFATYWGYNL